MKYAFIVYLFASLNVDIFPIILYILLNFWDRVVKGKIKAHDEPFDKDALACMFLFLM